MAKGSGRYRRSRLDQLRRHLLFFLPDPPLSKLSYSDQELDSTRAYVVLAHAEIEAFCEELVLHKAQSAKVVYDNSGNVRPALRRMVAYYVAKNGRSWNDVLNPPSDVVSKAFQSFQTAIRENNGVKQVNLEKLLFPLGVLDAHLSVTWLAQMDSFGRNRGGWAHKSVRALNSPDPLSELMNVNQLLRGLLDLDRILSRLR